MVQKTTVYMVMISIIVLLGIGYCTYKVTGPSSSGGDDEYLRGGHWHAKIDIVLCGEHKNLPFSPPGQSHKGAPTLHSHDDNKMHIETEGQIMKRNQISLGKFMDAVGVTFSATEIMDKKNGDLCLNSTTPGSVKMFVNELPNTEFRDYVPNLVPDAQMDTIKIEFS